MADGYDELTEKEKETLRLMARGHDAKSAAIALSLSVHAINERLRAARRKLAVTSSREAARLVLEHEDPENSVEEDLGDADGVRMAILRQRPKPASPAGGAKGAKPPC
ncbi:LuxR C-terminal-related transcriptional regulator [Qipengyuania sp.]|uniref:LuxR C-terminal-related transcriptional regulator n=1 Tax=Qipengyuania sp. TaxID=2004515 RepID=UPI00351532DA